MKTPVVVDVEQTSSVYVGLTIENCPRSASTMGRVFLPDHVQLKWRDGKLTVCGAFGRELRADGGVWLDGRRTGRSFLTPAHELQKDTPDWVLELVRQYEPV